MLKLKADALDWRIIEDEIVALDLRTSNYLAVNRAGTRLWPMIVQGAERQALVERLVSDYALSLAQATADVSAFLDLLHERGLLEGESSTAED